MPGQPGVPRGRSVQERLPLLRRRAGAGTVRTLNRARTTVSRRAVTGCAMTATGSTVRWIASWTAGIRAAVPMTMFAMFPTEAEAECAYRPSPWSGAERRKSANATMDCGTDQACTVDCRCEDQVGGHRLALVSTTTDPDLLAGIAPGPHIDAVEHVGAGRSYYAASVVEASPRPPRATKCVASTIRRQFFSAHPTPSRRTEGNAGSNQTAISHGAWVGMAATSSWSRSIRSRRRSHHGLDALPRYLLQPPG